MFFTRKCGFVKIKALGRRGEFFMNMPYSNIIGKYFLKLSKYPPSVLSNEKM